MPSFAKDNIPNSIEMGKPPLVKTAAKLFQDVMYVNKNGLLASIIVGGWDPIEGSQIYQLPPGGTLMKTKFAIGGSGSSYIYGFCDSNFRDSFSYEEARKFTVTGIFFILREIYTSFFLPVSILYCLALSLAMSRDGSSGGVIRMVTITKEGAPKRDFIPYQDLPFKK